MQKFLATAATALALVGTMVGAAAPANAQRFRGGYGFHGGHGYGYRGYGYRGYGYRGYGSGAAVAAGIIGLGVGAAIASNRGYGYGYGYAPPAYYDYGPAYYAPPPYAYAPGYCRSDWRWDGYRGRYVRVRFCD